jgi:hypothetical protein
VTGRIREDDIALVRERQTPWWAHRAGTHVHPAGAFSRRSLRTVAIRCLVAVAVTSGLFAAAVGTGQPRIRDGGPGNISIRQSTDALLGGCGRVFERRTPPGTAGVIASVKADGVTPNIPRYQTIVPMTGSFWSPPAEPGMYTPTSGTIPRPTQLLHNMWSGALDVYYTTAADAADVRTLAGVAATRADLNIIVVPWDSTRGPLPSGRKIALATWGASQTCQRLVVVALDQFRSAHPQGQAPGYGGAIAPTLRGTSASRPPVQ